MNILNIFSWVIFIIAIVLLWTVSWKIAVGIMLFGWAMNIENRNL